MKVLAKDSVKIISELTTAPRIEIEHDLNEMVNITEKLHFTFEDIFRPMTRTSVSLALTMIDFLLVLQHIWHGQRCTCLPPHENIRPVQPDSLCVC